MQAAVHLAASELLKLRGREALSVPLVASRAGVTPSTIYRRWGNLPTLLAEVAIERTRPNAVPPESESLRTDLLAWSERLLDRMASDNGLGMIRDALSSRASKRGSSARTPSRCAEFATSQIEVILSRWRPRGEPTPSVEEVLDAVVAPMLYRALYGREPPTRAHVRRLVDACVAGPR